MTSSTTSSGTSHSIDLPKNFHTDGVANLQITVNVSDGTNTSSFSTNVSIPNIADAPERLAPASSYTLTLNEDANATAVFPTGSKVSYSNGDFRLGSTDLQDTATGSNLTYALTTLPTKGSLKIGSTGDLLRHYQCRGRYL